MSRFQEGSQGPVWGVQLPGRLPLLPGVTWPGELELALPRGRAAGVGAGQWLRRQARVCHVECAAVWRPRWGNVEELGPGEEGKVGSCRVPPVGLGRAVFLEGAR